LAAYLLAQFEQLGGREAPSGDRFSAALLLALLGTVGGDGVADFVASCLADPEEVAGNRQRRAAGENEDERQCGERTSH
jgi:hypothetical protein